MTKEKHQPIVWLKELNLSIEQKELMAMLINLFGDDGTGHYFHPHADSDNLGNFSVTFLKEVLSNEKLIEGKSKQDANILTILESVEEILKKY